MKSFSGVKIWGHPKYHTQAVDLYVDELGILKTIVPTVQPKSGHALDCSNLYVLPAGVDVQVHLRVPGQSEKELPETGIKAALYGGYGAVLNMPNTKPTIDNPEVLREADQTLEKVLQKYGVTVLFSSSVSLGLHGSQLTDMQLMVDAGAAALTDDGKGVVPDDFMRSAFKVSADRGVPVLQHAEWPGHGGILAEGAVTQQLKLRPYDRKQEWGMVERDLKLLAEYPGALYHVLHVTTRETVELIRKAKDQGMRVTAEASPHHLYFCVDDIDPRNTSFKMNPPLHQTEDRAAIRAALNEGVIDFVATDHAPHERAAKGPTMELAAFGTIGMESSLRVLLTGIEQGWLRADRLVDVFSTAPAKLLGINSEYGAVKIGAPFRAVFFENSPPVAFGVKDIKSHSTNSIFLNVPLRGRIAGHYTRSGYFEL